MNERPPPSKLRQVIGTLMFLVVACVAIVFLVGPSREWVLNTFVRNPQDVEDRLIAQLRTKDPAEFFRDEQGHTGIRFTEEALDNLRVKPVVARQATDARALPPQIGTTQYDNDRLFFIQSRFPGELAWFKEFPDTDTPFTPTTTRPLRYGDKVKQGERLVVVWSQPLGQARANLVDAISNLRLSQKMLDLNKEAYSQGAQSLALLMSAERQEQLDRNALHTAERSLKMWKLTDKEIADIKAEAGRIAIEREKGRSQDLDKEMKWAWVELFAPRFNHDPNRELVVVEKNANTNGMLDPIASPPILKLADLSRLTIWAQPHEEYLPLLRERLNKGIHVHWQIQFQSDPQETKPLELPVVQIAPALDSTLHTPMVFGYLPNEDRRYFIGQFVTVTIFVDPDPDTVEIPTAALNETEGQALIFVQTNAQKREFTARRVAVVHRFKNVTIVRSKLTEQDLNYSVVERVKGRRPLEPLLPGEAVVTRGVNEMTVCLDTLAVKDQIENERQGK
jgi:multidrug efflux pump subunit AcrA (membrane-fusion protein)